MPLSEDEQRILQEIEQQFYARDPILADEISSHSIYAGCIRRMKWAGLWFTVGVVILVVALITATTFLVAFGGFVLMLVAALWFERSLRKLGEVGKEQLARSLRAGGLRDYFEASGERLRTRRRESGSEPDDH